MAFGTGDVVDAPSFQFVEMEYPVRKMCVQESQRVFYFMFSGIQCIWVEIFVLVQGGAVPSVFSIKASWRHV